MNSGSFYKNADEAIKEQYGENVSPLLCVLSSDATDLGKWGIRFQYMYMRLKH